MNRNSILSGFAGARFIAPFIALFFLIGCGEGPSPQTGGQTEVPKQTAKVEREPVILEVSGTVQSADQAQLAPRSPAFVREVSVVAGQKVKKDDLLVLMDDRNLNAQEDKLKAGRQELESALEEAKQGLDAAQAQKQLASNTFERIRALYEKEAASKQEFEEAESRAKAAEASYRAAQARISEVQARQAKLQSDQMDLKATSHYVRIVSPFNGIVTDVPAKAGTYFNPGQPVVSLENPSRYQLVIAVEENLLKSLQKNQMVGVRISSLSNDLISGNVAEISPAMDMHTRTFRLKIDLPPTSSLLGGVSGVALVRSASKTLWIPADYVRVNQDVESVLVRSGETWRRVLVKTGRRKEGKVEILSGLDPDDEVGV